jgi:hypothetical protein
MSMHSLLFIAFFKLSFSFFDLLIFASCSRLQGRQNNPAPCCRRLARIRAQRKVFGTGFAAIAKNDALWRRNTSGAAAVTAVEFGSY